MFQHAAILTARLAQQGDDFFHAPDVIRDLGFHRWRHAHRAEILPYLDRIRSDHGLSAIYVTHTCRSCRAR